MEERFPDAKCPRCQVLAQLYTVPLKLVPSTAEEAWQALCNQCFRQVLEVEPDENLQMRPIRRVRGGRR